ncbi:MAG: TonB C-terminal domain-containing protein [Betaproteobacteria bacterium]|nr:TonB C-terminal domain-containing protein [Betaproteobacteria bacterium]
MNYNATPEPGRKAALAISLTVHSLLVLALFFGLQWRTEHAPVEVELWSAIPTPAARPPAPKPLPEPEVAPTPPPEEIKPIPTPPPEEVKPVPKPDIAVKRDEPKKEPAPKPAPPKEPVPKKPDFSKALEEELREIRQNELLAQAERESLAAGRKIAEDAWVGKIQAKIRSNVVQLPNIAGNPQAVFRVQLLPTGEVILSPQPRLIRSSGNSALDDTLLRAILRSSPLPLPDNPAAFQRELELTLRPYDD